MSRVDLFGPIHFLQLPTGGHGGKREPHSQDETERWGAQGGRPTLKQSYKRLKQKRHPSRLMTHGRSETREPEKCDADRFQFQISIFFFFFFFSLSLSLSFCLLPSISVHRRRYPILNGRPRTLLRSMPHHNSISNRNQNIPRGAPPPPVREAARAVTAFEAVTVDDYRPESNFWFIFGSFEAVKFPENRSFAHFLDRKSSHITSPYPLPPFLSLFAYFLPSHPPRCSLLPYKDNIYIKKKQFIDWYLEFLYGICA